MKIFFISLFAFISFASAFPAEESNDSIEVPFSIDTEDKDAKIVELETKNKVQPN